MNLEYPGVAAASAIVMSDVLKREKVVLVEGTSEICLINDLFPNLYPISAVGQMGVLEAINALEEEYGEDLRGFLIIGFVDRDYITIKDYRNIMKCKNIITTHFRDIEIDMLHTDILKRLLEEKGSSNKWTNIDLVLLDILSCLEILSYLRVYNHVKEKCWSFKKVDLTGYCSTKGEVNYKKLISSFMQNNQIKQTEWGEFEEWKKNNIFDLPEITRGHDATCVLGQMLRSKLGNREKSESSLECIEENLRLAARVDKLYKFDWVQKLKSINEFC